MKGYAILFAVFHTLFASAQEKQAKPVITDFKKILVSANFSPDICYRTLKSKESNSNAGQLIEIRNEEEGAKFGFTTGINVCFNFTKLIGLETGIQYSNKGYLFKEHELIYNYPDPGLPITVKFIYNYHYIDIPLKVNFIVGKKSVRFCASAGLTTNIFIDESFTSILEYSNGDTERETNSTDILYKRMNFSPTAGAGIDVKLNDRMSLKVEPTFRYGVVKLTSPIATYLWNGGLNISYYFGI